MVLNTESKYPNRRAYVLKLRGDAHPGAIAGRLENLVTGRQLEFASASELLDAITRELQGGDGDGATRA
ncbi:MAG: hypothetical protein ACXWC2_03680 [Ramlibacter sp.]